ncbi:unnamed protein product [Gongylonema pulchrum]|uniref:Uncharacterized protein n=1 Tax=Gongylonema pulchrum TaxID=637853 RepID=A0A3P7N967_9BILA|nr:unnamed protein product [Gongylonema pulchrum]
MQRTSRDKKEDSELEEDKAYAAKLIRANRHFDELLHDLDDKTIKFKRHSATAADVQKILEDVWQEANKSIEKGGAIEKNGAEWNPFEIIFFYLQTQPEMFSRLLALHSSDKYDGE